MKKQIIKAEIAKTDLSNWAHIYKIQEESYFPKRRIVCTSRGIYIYTYSQNMLAVFGASGEQSGELIATGLGNLYLDDTMGLLFIFSPKFLDTVANMLGAQRL